MVLRGNKINTNLALVWEFARSF